MIEIQLQDLDLVVKRLRGLPGAADWAIMRTLNDVAVSGKAIAVQDIYKRYNLKESDVSKGVKISPATMDRPVAIIRISGKRFPIQLFKPTQTPEGVEFEEVRGKRSSISHVFTAVMKYGPGVFSRLGSSRGPVRSVTGLSVANMARETTTVLPDMEARIKEQLVKRARYWMEEALKPGGYLQEKYGRHA